MVYNTSRPLPVETCGVFDYHGGRWLGLNVSEAPVLTMPGSSEPIVQFAAGNDT